MTNRLNGKVAVVIGGEWDRQGYISWLGCRNCNLGACSGSHNQETDENRSESLHNFTDFQYDSF